MKHPAIPVAPWKAAVHRFAGVLATAAFSAGLLFQAANAGMPFVLQQGQTIHPPAMTLDELDTAAVLDLRPLRYTFRMNLAEETDGHYPARTTLTLLNTSGSMLPTLVLDAAASTIAVQQVTDEETADTYTFAQADDQLSIAHTLAPGDSIRLAIDYQLTPGTILGPFGAMGLWWDGTRGYTFSFPDGAHAWAPVIDSPAAKAPVAWEIGTPPPLTAVANGIPTSDETPEGVRWQTWEESTPVCTSEMGLCVANYTVIEAETGTFPIRYFVYPADSSAAVFDFERIPEAVGVFEEEFGYPFPFLELKIVECEVFGGSGGQEHQGMISLGSNLITGNRQYESIVVHEVAHQWFADLLTPVDWDHFWLNEGFATYSEAIWAEHLNGWSGYRSAISQYRNAFLGWLAGGNNQALVNSDYFATMNTALPYERGALALHQLRMRYGMDIFTETVGNYLADNAYGYVASETLRDAFHETTGDDSLGAWFDQWVWRGEAPSFRWARSPDGGEIHVRQMRSGSGAPSHGELYDCFHVYAGDPSTPDNPSYSWPTGAETMTLGGLEGNDAVFLPNLEVPARIQEVEGLSAPDPRATLSVIHETGNQDRVLQPGETMTLQFSLANTGLPWETPGWTVITDSGEMTWTTSSGTLSSLEFLQPSRPMLELNVTGGGDSTPRFGRFHLRLSGSGQDAVDIRFTIAMGTPEVLLISDGIEGVADSLAPALERVGIVWGEAGVPIPELPETMFGARVIMVEADGRTAEDLFTPDDLPVRNWFMNGGGGSVCGIYMDQIYPNADPSWLGGLAGEWYEPINYSVFLGVEGDEVADGRAIVNTVPQGSSTCFPCCGTPPIYWTTDNEYVVGSNVDIGWRIVNFGFALSRISNMPTAPMSRDELAQRVANWTLYRSTGVAEEASPARPGGFRVDAWPNPFNDAVRISVQVPGSDRLRIDVFNLLGERVARLYDQPASPGIIHLNWQASGQASGVYILRVAAGSRVSSHKIVLMR